MMMTWQHAQRVPGLMRASNKGIEEERRLHGSHNTDLWRPAQGELERLQATTHAVDVRE